MDRYATLAKTGGAFWDRFATPAKTDGILAVSFNQLAMPTDDFRHQKKGVAIDPFS
jgi:hypothetical protein